MTELGEKDKNNTPPVNTTQFSPHDDKESLSHLPALGTNWSPVISSPAAFSTDSFLVVMENLIRNPQITAKHLFRADIFYDSEKDTSMTRPFAEPGNGGDDRDEFSDYVVHLRPEYRPRRIDQVSSRQFEWRRTWVRQLVPRNPAVDKPLVQSCHLLVSKDTTVLLYVPHVSAVEELPFYHPSVAALAMMHQSGSTDGASSAVISIQYQLFPSTPLNERLERTALQMLRIIHKHGEGDRKGYVKRVHHDQVIPQASFQNTYVRLKQQYAAAIVAGWVETTDPSKHVFEDLGIAAFLMELWRSLYGDAKTKAEGFPGFVDIGCGNGLLVNVLTLEGYEGWGFDARRRKSWETYSLAVQERLKACILVPSILSPVTEDEVVIDASNGELPQTTHKGVYPKGTFIISNHADELTPWTPLLASLSRSPFIAIPCCSHSLTGARHRHAASPNDLPAAERAARAAPVPEAQQPKHGDLKRGKAPSAYQSLCVYLERISKEIGYEMQREWLRIPSTRNVCLVGRPGEGKQTQRDELQRLVEREVGMSLVEIEKEWLRRAEAVMGKKGDH